MSKLMDKIKVATGIDKRSTVDLSCDHVTTMKMFEPRIVYSRALCPKSSIDINVENLTRMQALNVPTFLRMKMVYRAFFVPYRTVYKDWNNFITNVPTSQSVVQKYCLNFSNVNFVNWFLMTNSDSSANIPPTATGNSMVDTVVTTVPSAYDICYQYKASTASTYTPYYITLSAQGRKVLNILYSLGYKFYWQSNVDESYNLYPLLSYLKVCDDWYVSQQYSDSTLFKGLWKAINNAAASVSPEIFFGYYNSSSSSWVTYDLGTCLILGTKGYYEPSYFTSAFNSPTGPKASSSQFQIPNLAPNRVQAEVSANGDTLLTNTATGTFINQYALDAMKSLSDFMKRHQLAGGKAIDRYLAKYGVMLSAEKLNRCNYLGAGSSLIQIGEVMSTAETSSANIGEYAGKGYGYSTNGNFKCNTDEFGHIIIVAQIIPTNMGYISGVNRENLKHDYMDFFQAEFDGLGNQAIARNELLCDMDATVQEYFDSNTPDQVYGYIPRYAEYKVGNDCLSGDYLFGSINSMYKPYSPFRAFGSYGDSNTEGVVSIYGQASDNILDTGNDGVQFTRIFQGASSNANVDYFNTCFHFDVKCSIPMSPLFENYEFDHNGEKVSMTVNGTVLNGKNE